MSENIVPVILCGGSGTRLWPLSRKDLPKQFVPLIDGKSLLTLTLERAARLSRQVICVASDEHRHLLQETIDALSLSGTLLLEPVARNTAAAMAVAALNAAPDDLLLFLAADHHIPDAESFAATIRQGVPAALAGRIVTFGVVPSFPSTAYGYVEKAGPLGAGSAAFAVARFVEKPDAQTAQAMLLRGGYLWNAGMFLVRAGTLIDALRQHAPDILQTCTRCVEQQTRDSHFVRFPDQVFASCRAQSFDYAVMERHAAVAVVPFAGVWSDVGSWNAVADLYPADAAGNRIHGDVTVVDGRNTFVYAPHHHVVALGTRDLVIVDTPDAVLVADIRRAEEVKAVVASLHEQGRKEAVQHRRVARPWGAYDSIDRGERFQVKRITVKPGGKLSLQLHHHRAEHWIVVSGLARVTRGAEVFDLCENQSTYIPLGVVHRLENPGAEPLELIEVQSGHYLGEDDIVRLQDSYGRVDDTQPAADPERAVR